MIVKELNDREFRAVCRLYYPDDFPSAERKSVRLLRKLRANGICSAYGLFTDEGLTAYAFFQKRPESAYRLLDYYAVCGARGQGAGSAFMKALAKLFEDEICLIGEVECPETAITDGEEELRHRRKRFYAKNGWDPTDCRCDQYGVTLDILTLPLSGVRYEDESVFSELDALYRILYPRAYRSGRVRLYRIEES